MSDTATVVVDEIGSKAGETNGRAWTKHSLKDANGTYYSTFDDNVIRPARELQGKKAVIEYEVDGKFKNLVKVEPFEESPISARADDGSADWDMIGLRKTRCLLWANYLGDGLGSAIAMAMKSSSPNDAEIANFVQRFGKQLVTYAEHDIYSREPATPDDTVPF